MFFVPNINSSILCRLLYFCLYAWCTVNFFCYCEHLKLNLEKYSKFKDYTWKIISKSLKKMTWNSGISLFFRIKKMWEPCMSRNRFESLKRFLHFNDNDNALPPNDEKRGRLFKIRPIFEKAQTKLYHSDTRGILLGR